MYLLGQGGGLFEGDVSGRFVRHAGVERWEDVVAVLCVCV